MSELIEFYTERFGSETLLILDVAGGRFESGAYSVVSQVMFVMDAKVEAEDYAIYLFNHKGYKRSEQRLHRKTCWLS